MAGAVKRAQRDPAGEAEELRQTLLTSLMGVTEQLAPIFDTAGGMRADLENRGWSPTAAEQIALTWLMGAMGAIAAGPE